MKASHGLKPRESRLAPRHTKLFHCFPFASFSSVLPERSPQGLRQRRRNSVERGLGPLPAAGRAASVGPGQRRGGAPETPALAHPTPPPVARWGSPPGRTRLPPSRGRTGSGGARAGGPGGRRGAGGRQGCPSPGAREARAGPPSLPGRGRPRRLGRLPTPPPAAQGDASPITARGEPQPGHRGAGAPPRAPARPLPP